MIEVTTLAQDKLAAYMKENNVSSPLRIMLMQGGCSGSTLGLAIDEKKPDDEAFTPGELTFLIDKSLLLKTGNITIDFLEAGGRSGFSITSANPVAGPASGCNSGSCSSGGCGC